VKTEKANQLVSSTTFLAPQLSSKQNIEDMVFRLTTEQFLELGLETIVGFDHSRTCQPTVLRRWHAYYGASPETCAQLFYDLQTTQVQDARVERPDPYEFLIAFYWLKGNETDEKLAGQFKMDEKTARKWKWYYVHRISAMTAQKVSLDDQHIFPLAKDHKQLTALLDCFSAIWYSG
jgi:hypothetical protein